ncbi:hypothetical protein AUC68_07885 [Methyloceanibacter methanicus]|uniref:Metal-binding protein n=1 Tax=Methyloceanibacter methanicus TaxID=1774968 RepID=A0A1E3W0L4_9HYPH|nr:DUF177 domain-containing protein [Methyloceanibacter methanicus]ODR99051.1 hypothetical protein AUC68_07885 [Methyloceanibacter methanicus]
MTQNPNEDLQAPPLTRKIRLGEIDQNADKTIQIAESERETIMALLDLRDLAGLSFVYRLRPGSGKRVLLTGRLEADVVQTCVVSLEPLPAHIDVPVKAEFWPPEKIAELQARAEDPVQASEIDWPEAIEGDAIDLGPLVYETLATSLDPYPKKAGVDFQWSDAKQDAETPKNSPFAVLKDLKDS